MQVFFVISGMVICRLPGWEDLARLRTLTVSAPVSRRMGLHSDQHGLHHRDPSKRSKSLVLALDAIFTHLSNWAMG